ncbi:hypothetical protein LTR85_010958 [Meristemomyces frigidus]|nr:hypothetical protein LTR85_010958 [Meristemomyces frigidus]
MANSVIRALIAMQLALFMLLFHAAFGNAAQAAVDVAALSGLTCSKACWSQNAKKEGCSNSDTNVEHDCMCGASIIPYCAFSLCNSDCRPTKGGLPAYMQCPPIFNDNGGPVIEQEILAEPSDRRSEVDVPVFEPVKREDAIGCTDFCWLQGITHAKCTNSDASLETACMCSSETSYGIFYYCALECVDIGSFAGLSDDQECIGYRHRMVRDQVDSTSDEGDDHPPAMPHHHGTDHLPSMSTVVVSTVHLPPMSGPIWSGILPPTTFMTEIMTAAEDSVLSVDKRQIIGQIPWRHDTTTKSKKHKTYTHYSDAVSATIGFCGTPGTSCDEKNVVPEGADSSNATTTVSTGTTSATAAVSLTANSTLALATPAPVLEVRDATFIPSLVRICNVTDLVDCYYPLAPDLADDQKDLAMGSTTSIPWAPTTLASYAPNTWNGAPPTTLATYAGKTFDGQPPPPKRSNSVSPSGDCEIPGGDCGTEQPGIGS